MSGLRGALNKLHTRLHRRAMSYQALFVRPGGELAPAADVVLKDLARYCYANRPTLKVSQVTQQSDALAMAFAEGRRDVWNRITAMCALSDDQIARIATARGNDDE